MGQEKILILSDIHRSTGTAAKIIDEHKDASVIIFLGDGEVAFETAMAECGINAYESVSPNVCMVSGNCDWDSMFPQTITPVLGGVKICVTHGHGYSVKSKPGLFKLSEAASARGCTVALFGHTHSRFNEVINGVKLFNPGAVQNGQYGLAFVNDGNIELEHRSV